MVINTSPSTLRFENLSSYNHGRDGGDVPNARYMATSSMNFSGITNNLPILNANSIYEGNLNWNCPNQITQSDLNLPKGIGTNTSRGQLILHNGYLSLIGTGTSDQFIDFLNFTMTGAVFKINTPNFKFINGVNNFGNCNIILNGVSSSLVTGRYYETSRFAKLSGTGTLKTTLGVYILPDYAGTVAPIAKLVEVPMIQCAYTTCTNFLPDPVYVEVRGIGSNSVDVDLPENIVYNLRINNPGGATLAAPVVASNLDLTVGKLTTTATNLLTLTETATVSVPTSTVVASNTYVEGPIAKRSNSTTSFTLPIGNDFSYKPITITPQDSNLTTFQAQYFNTPPPNSALRTSPVSGLFTNGYYDVSRPSGTANAKLGLTYSGVIEPNMLVAHYITGSWRLEGRIPTIVTNGSSFTITTSNFVSSFSPFAIGFSSSVLPVEFLDFKATPSVSDVKLNWSTASEVNTSYFDIERSNDGRVFEKMGETKALGKAATYAYLDKMVGMSTTLYYRLKINETDGKSNFSKTITVERNKDLSIKAYPNPMHDELIIELPSTPQKWAIEITDLLGRVIFKQNTEGSNLLTINTLKWELGVYILKVSDKQNSVQQKIIKQ